MSEVEDTKDTTDEILERMENTLNNLEQMSFSSINSTDKLVSLVDQAREHNVTLKIGDLKERTEANQAMTVILDEILNVAFEVNNLSHQLEQETVYQRDTAEEIKQVMDYLVAF